MAIRPRSLINNSIGSVLASGMLIFSTVLIPAVLARGLTRGQYNAYSLVLASLPLMLILPQSMRSVGATQLALAIVRHGEKLAIAEYKRFVAKVSLAYVVVAAVGIEIYVAVSHPVSAAAAELRFGLYCILAYTLGLIAAGLVIAPAAAQRDFLPDNIAKFWPGLFQLGGVALVWLTRADHPLVWIFLVYIASSWSIAALLLTRHGKHLFHAGRLSRPPTQLNADLLLGLRGVLWWNVTAYLATAAAVMIVAIGFPAQIVPFSIATSLLGILSAALGAVAAPIAVHATASREHAPRARRRFFLVINTLFQSYIAATTLIIVAAPVSLYALWLTPQLAAEVKTFSLLLLPASIIRLLTMNFTIFVMSAGRQHTLWMSPMVEAIMSVVGSIILGRLFGVTGIPLALAFSAAVRLTLTALYDEPRNRGPLALAPGDVLLSAWRLIRFHQHLVSVEHGS